MSQSEQRFIGRNAVITVPVVCLYVCLSRLLSLSKLTLIGSKCSYYPSSKGQGQMQQNNKIKLIFKACWA